MRAVSSRLKLHLGGPIVLLNPRKIIHACRKTEMLPGRYKVSDSAAYTHEEGAIIRIDIRQAPLQIGED